MSKEPLKLALSHCESGDLLVDQGAWGASAMLYQLGLQALGAPQPDQLPQEDERAALELRQHLLAHIEQELRQATREHGAMLRGLRGWLRRIAAFLGAALALHLGWHETFERDLSAGCAWVASSRYSSAAARGRLPERTWTQATPNYFFHTKTEESPWIKVDLGQTRLVRAIEIVNRIDCCWERSGRLIIELSEDGKTYEQVAHRSAARPSRRWKKKIEPRRARWIRVTSSQKAPLHFADLRVFGS